MQLFIILILTVIIIITCQTGNVDHDIMITLTFNIDWMEIKKKKKSLLMKILMYKMSVTSHK